MKALTLGVCKRRLATLWFGLSAPSFLIFLLQTCFGRYADYSEEAWSWLLPTFMPTLSLIIAVLVADANTPGRNRARIDRFLFQLAYWVSAAYLLVILLTILMQPFAEDPNNPMNYLRLSQLWLAPLHGLAAAALGAFFIKIGRADGAGAPAQGVPEPAEERG